MPFRLTNIPATFQTYINKALNRLVNNICVVYLDNILIYSKSQESYIHYIGKVLTQLRRFGLYTNVDKYKFLISEVDFFSFIVNKDSIRIDP